MTSDASADLESRLRRSRRWNIILIAVTAFLAIVVAAQLLQGGSSPTEPAQSQPSESAQQSAGASTDMDFVRRDADDPMAIGDVDAPVVLTMWTDPRCPFCALFSRETLPVLVEEYVDAGHVRVEFNEVEFFGQQSEEAAVAALAAARQDRYIEFITAVYEAAPEKGHPDLPREKLIDFATQAGVPDMEAFEADLDDFELVSDVRSSTKNAQQLGVTAVPFFVAGNIALSGAQPVENFRSLLDQALAAAE